MVLTLLLACSETPGATDSAVVDLGELTVEADEVIPNVLHVSWAGIEGETRIDYGLDGALTDGTPYTSGDSTIVLGLKSGRSYRLQAHARLADGSEGVSAPVDVEIVFPDADLPGLTVEDADPGAWAGDGFTLMSIFQGGGSWLAMIDRDGDYVWMYPSRQNTAIPTAHITPDGKGVIYVDNDFVGSGWGGIGHVSFDRSIEQFREVEALHHDAIVLPDGSYAWLQFENRTVMTQDGVELNMTSDAVYDAPSLDAEPRKVFSLFDDYGHDPWIHCWHARQEVPIVGGEDFTHGNSLVYDAWDDAYLYMPKHLDAILALDRASGSLEWQAGGRYGDFTDVDGDVADDDHSYIVDGPHRTWWSHAHFSEAWESGFVLYDNGSHHEPLVSRVAAYEWDTSARTLRRTFAFSSETGIYDPVLGDVRRLDNGNWLASWTLVGMITELTPDGRVVWRVSTDIGSAIGRIGYVSSMYGEQ